MDDSRREFLRNAFGFGVAVALSPVGTLEGFADENERGHTFGDYIDAVVQIESGGNPRAERYEPKLKDYSYGLGQLLTRTAKDVERRHPELPRLGNSEEEIRQSLFNPQTNRAYTGALFREELDFYREPDIAVAAYNSGHLTPRNARCQEQLNQLVPASLDTDGIIGPQSKEVVKKFQEKHGLDDDGVIGPITYSKIQEVWTSDNPGRENPKGIVPNNNYTPNHVRKFKKALEDISSSK